MEYRFLGKSGLQVSELTLGTMTFGGTGPFEKIGKTQVEEAKRLIDICLEAGLTTFDTADMYSLGLSETILGQAVGKARRDKVLIATKAFMRVGEGVHDVGLSRQHIIKACEESLRRLGTDYIDLYQVHSFDSLTPLEETLQALDRLVQDGKVRYIGNSNYAAWQSMKARAVSDRHNYQHFCSQQIHYSLLSRDAEMELLPFGIDQGVGAMIWSPLSFGLLSGKYKRGNIAPPNSRSEALDVLGTIDWEKVFAIVDALVAVAKKKSKTVPQVALNWLLRRKGVSTVIIGARTEAQLRDNLGAVGWHLSAEEMQFLDKASHVKESYPTWHQRKFAGERNPHFVTV